MPILTEMKFRCEKCGALVQKDVRVNRNIGIEQGDVPEGWRIVSEWGVFFAYCPLHTESHKW